MLATSNGMGVGSHSASALLAVLLEFIIAFAPVLAPPSKDK
jgi:hypothetical protein